MSRTSTTWEAGSTWRTGKTKTIRVPEAIADEVMRCAREIDAGNAVLHGNIANEEEIILNAIANYIILRGNSRHPNQHGKSVDVSTRTWDELRKFAAIVETQPEKLGLQSKAIEN